MKVMKFAPMKEILKLAEEQKVAYGAFVTVSYETALAAIEAGSELNCPVIFITGTDCCDLMGGFEGTVETVKRAAANAQVPIALHLDHCRTYEECVQAIHAGYSSVMIDGSSLPFEENIALTKKVVDYAHTLGITVEGELGKLVGEEGNLVVKGPEGAQTDPQEAKEFVERTGVDCLAVSIGTQHGHYIAAPQLNIERLKAIQEVVEVPLVLHGGSGTPIDQVQESIRHGIRKINVATDVLTAVADSFEELKKQPGFKYNTAMFVNSKNAAKELIKGKMKDFRFEK
ncbi:fructose-bisphosphate aldolase class II [Kineothrix alysoides]|jgi:fructose-bisphosphate aldolase class II|uniref:Fructose-bisphosphate aldolase class II n=2 Tax=Kineothrix alysoides TaxID=1469948 RepID=A0A4R1QWQ9_9FIRM|nr:class II fructose-bisphosphate aldolase [Kineothrix alysoides]TCL57315.1 fructose-bisphosphate aldolase class II [Kineothrix alysoides]